MISKSLVEMTKGRAREFFREPSAFFFVLLMPILWMTILGMAFSNPETMKLSVGIVTDGPHHDALVDHLKSQKHLVVATATDKDALSTQMIRGNILAIAEIAAQSGQGENEASATGVRVNYIYDSKNPNAATARLALDDTIQRFHGRVDQVAIGESTIDVPGRRYIDFLVPGLLALSLMTSSLFGTGMTIVVNRRENLLKRYLTTPMKSWEYIVSHVFNRIFIMLVEFAAIMAFAMVIFDFRLSGRWLDYVVFTTIGTATFTALGVMCGARTKNGSAYNGIVNLIFLPMMMLSGVWFSTSNFPKWLSAFTDYLPLTSLVDGLRRIALEGASLDSLGFEIALMSVFTFVFAAIAVKRFRWY